MRKEKRREGESKGISSCFFNFWLWFWSCGPMEPTEEVPLIRLGESEMERLVRG